jgi:signal peptidase I
VAVRTLIVGRRPGHTLARVLLLLIGTGVVFGVLVIPIRGVGPSMAPAIEDGQLVFANRMAYAFTEPRRGDVVAIRAAGRRVVYLKRIVALPGERVRLESGVVLLADVPLDEPYVRHRAPWSTAEAVLQPDEYLVIGDNRGMPLEAHTFGAVRRDRIVGRVVPRR